MDFILLKCPVLTANCCSARLQSTVVFLVVLLCVNLPIHEGNSAPLKIKNNHSFVKIDAPDLGLLIEHDSLSNDYVNKTRSHLVFIDESFFFREKNRSRFYCFELDVIRNSFQSHRFVACLHAKSLSHSFLREISGFTQYGTSCFGWHL